MLNFDSNDKLKREKRVINIWSFSQNVLAHKRIINVEQKNFSVYFLWHLAMILLLLQSYLGIIFFVTLQSKINVKNWFSPFISMYAKAWWFGTKISIASQRALLFDNKNISFHICIHDTISFDSPVLRARKKKKKRDFTGQEKQRLILVNSTHNFYWSILILEETAVGVSVSDRDVSTYKVIQSFLDVSC